jgi:pSer/pThr/pTyr-binding forkhead associated (FHA) protein
MAKRFLIVRKDLALDQVIIESEGLTIGRLTGNDLVLNHPTVSRTQAGIKDVNGQFWVFNLSSANGTLLNGELIDKVPLADGDVLQIGPFLLNLNFGGEDLLIEVEANINVTPLDTTLGIPAETTDETGKTVLLKLPATKPAEVAPKMMTLRLSNLTGLLSGGIGGIDNQALKVFWEKRKREAGKLTSESPLQPRGRVRLGKAQFNWRPTFDLQRSWPKAVLIWGPILVIALSAIASLLYLKAFSPGPLSVAHARSSLSPEAGIALKANADSCTQCHTLSGSMTQNCAACHTAPKFSPQVSDVHEKVGLDCLACHTEHRGMAFRPAIVANEACVRCHQNGSGVISPITGKALTTPHGGTLGYPVANGEWTWAGLSEREWSRRELIGRAGDFSVKDQFHLVHLGGREQGRTYCSECHKAGFDGENLTTGVRESCVNCHSMNAQSQTRAAAIAGSRSGTAACVSCHSQHGDERNSSVGLRKMTVN